MNMKPSYNLSKEGRRRAWEAYCAHIAKGLAPKSFRYHEENCHANFASMQRQLRDYPEDCDHDMLEDAEAANFGYWEKVGLDLMYGLIKFAIPSVWVMNMKNRFGWEKDSAPKEAPQVVKIISYKKEEVEDIKPGDCITI